MELDDSFTEKLIQRTKARKEKIRKIKDTGFQSTGIKRAALTEESQIPSEANFCDDGILEESPKRQCLETSSTDTNSDEDDKENSFCQEKEPESFIPVHSTGPKRGLAALKNKVVGQFETTSVPLNETESQVNKCRTYMYSTNTSELFNDRKSRFANLAENIKQWEDDSYTPSQRLNKVTLSNTSKSSQSSATHGYKSNSSSSSKSLFNNFPSVSDNSDHNILKHVTFKQGHVEMNGQSVASKGGVGSVESCMSSSLQKGSIVKAKNACHRQEQICDAWDEAVTAALETSLIAKPPAHYQPDIAENLNYIDEDDIDMEDEEGLDEESKCVNKPCMEEKANSVIQLQDKTPAVFRFNQSAKKLPSPKVVKESINDARDPAELPLSARKALFERAFFGESSKPTDSVFEPKLSVAQRAAMFEKATRTCNQSPKKPQVAVNRFISPVASPVKCKPIDSRFINSPVKVATESPKKQFKNSAEDLKGSPAKYPSVECTLSPSKTVGNHTRIVQQQLMENANTNWQQNELVARAAEQRKTELSSLVNHWEKMSSSSKSSESTNNSDTANAHFGERNSVDIYEPVFKNGEDIEDDLESEREDDNENAKNESINASEDEYSECPNNESENEQSDAAEGTVNAVCDEMDELLEAALDTKEEILHNGPEFKKPALMASKTSSYNSYSSVESDVDTGSDCSTPLPAATSHNLANPEVPLLYTVSLYRKKKQEVRTPPVRTIVRREKVMSPPSPKVDRKALVEDQIKALEEEVKIQQTVISQTSQALNLCQATAEFSGSTEQVEGERLLLIATQKRQALLNEIQRLKTQGSQNEFINDGTGTLTISDIQLCLKREFMASELQGKSNDTVHNFLCLFRHGSQVIVSQMLSTNDTVTDGALCFTNHIKIQNLQADFSVVFEVYALQTKKDSLPHEKKYHIKREHSKLRLTPKHKRLENKILLPAVSSPGGPNAVRSPSFGVVGYTRFTIQNFSRKVFSLDKVPFVSPLDGILKAKVRLHAEHKVVEKGFLTMFEDVSGFGAWHRRWCVLDGHYVSFWKYPDDENRRDPMGVIDLKQCVTGQVRLASREVCARPHTFHIVTVRPQTKGDKNTLISRSVDTLTTTKHLISADTKEERILWCNKINEALTNVRKWDPKAVRPIA